LARRIEEMDCRCKEKWVYISWNEAGEGNHKNYH